MPVSKANPVYSSSGPRFRQALPYLLIITLLTMAGPVTAATITMVPNDPVHLSINATIHNATAGDTIILGQGTYTETKILVDRNIRIQADTAGNHGPSDTIIDGNNAGRIMNVNSGVTATIDNLTFTKGSAAGDDGGAIYNAGTLTITSSTFSSCSAGRGGAILNHNTGTLSITASTFSSCSATQNGGAIISAGTLSISRSSFSSCSAASSGGAVFGSGTIDASSFSSCTAGNNGGALWLTSDTTITTSSFTSCSAVTQGGAILTSSGLSTVEFSRFYQNTAPSGPAITDSGLTITSAKYNWWGTNADPAADISGIAAGTYTPWLVLGSGGSPASITSAQTAVILANLTFDSAGSNTIASGHIRNGTQVTFAIVSGPGSHSTATNTTTLGAAETTFTPAGAGITNISATVDGQTTFTMVSATQSPPAAAFSGTPTSGAAPLPVLFTDASTNTPAGWAWYFGDESWTGTGWTLQSMGPWATYRTGHGSGVLPDGSIILTGGLDQTTNPPSFYNDTWRSTDKGVTWTLQSSSPGWFARSGHENVVLPDGSIVLLGGSSERSDMVTIDYNDTWRSADKGATWSLQGSAPVWPARGSHTTVALADGSIVLMGGRDNKSVCYNDTWQSADKGATWSLVSAKAPWIARWGHTSVVLPDGSIMLSGGRDATLTYYNDTWRSTDKGATWSRVSATAPWIARNSHTSVVLPDGSIILMGGYSASGDLNDVWRSTDQGASWTRLADHAEWIARSGHTSVVLPDASIIISGGSTGTGSAILVNNSWRLATATTLQSPSHTYTQAGTYTVTEQAYNTGGWDRLTKTAYIAVSIPAPVVAFTGTPVSGAPPLPVQFNETSTNSPTTWNWSFGDGTWFNTTDVVQKNISHTYPAAGSYTVQLIANNTGGSGTLAKAGYISVALPTTPTPAPTPSPAYSGWGNGGDDFPGTTPTPGTPGKEQLNPAGQIIIVNIGGNSGARSAVVSGSGIADLIITGMTQAGPGTGIPPPPGTVYQYIDISPARYITITSAVITFSIPQAWLDEHDLRPEDIVMYHYVNGAWVALPTTVVSTANGIVTFTATSPGFSLFAIIGKADASTTTTSMAQTTGVPIGAATPSPAPVVSVPVTTSTVIAETTTVPPLVTAPAFPLPVIIIAGIVILAAGGFIARRWYIRRQNPALFADDD